MLPTFSPRESKEIPGRWPNELQNRRFSVQSPVLMGDRTRSARLLARIRLPWGRFGSIVCSLRVWVHVDGLHACLDCTVGGDTGHWCRAGCREWWAHGLRLGIHAAHDDNYDDDDDSWNDGSDDAMMIVTVIVTKECYDDGGCDKNDWVVVAIATTKVDGEDGEAGREYTCDEYVRCSSANLLVAGKCTGIVSECGWWKEEKKVQARRWKAPFK